MTDVPDEAKGTSCAPEVGGFWNGYFLLSEAVERYSCADDGDVMYLIELVIDPPSGENPLGRVEASVLWYLDDHHPTPIYSGVYPSRGAALADIQNKVEEHMERYDWKNWIPYPYREETCPSCGGDLEMVEHEEGFVCYEDEIRCPACAKFGLLYPEDEDKPRIQW